MEALLQKFFVFIVLMLIGYVGARKNMLNPEFTRAASKLTLNVFMSATILNAVIVNPPTLSGKDLLYALFITFLVVLIGYLVGALVVRILPIQKERAPLFELLIGVMNSMFIGVPVAELLYGSQAVFYIALSNIFFNLFLYTYGVLRLNKGEQGGLRLKNVLSVPLMATFVSVLIFMLRIPVPTAIRGLIGSAAGATMPLSMIVIGSSLGRVKLTDALRQGNLYLVALFRLLIVPGLTWLLFLFLPADPLLRAGMIIMSACPSGVVVSILAIQYGRDVEYSSEAILLDTALSMLTIPLVVSVLI